MVQTFISISEKPMSRRLMQAFMWSTSWWLTKLSISWSAGAGTNYQVSLLIWQSSWSSWHQFHVDSLATLFPTGKWISGSLRFYSSDQSTPLSFWVENVTGSWSNKLAKIWVKVTENLDTGKDIYMWVTGDTSNVCNGTNTFIFFDDFVGASIDTWKRTVVNGTWFSVSWDKLNGSNTTGRLSSIVTLSDWVEMVTLTKTISKSTSWHMSLGTYIGSSNWIGILDHNWTVYYRNDSSRPDIAPAIADNVDILQTIKIKSNLVRINIKNYATWVSSHDITSISNTVSSEPITIWYRYDNVLSWQWYNSTWDWIYAKKYTVSDPAFVRPTLLDHTIAAHTKNFDSTAEFTTEGWSNVISYGNGLWVTWWLLYPAWWWSDWAGHLKKNISAIWEWKCQVRMYLQSSTRWWDQVFNVNGWMFPVQETTNRNKNPWHYINMTTASSYWWTSGIWDWTTQWSEYSSSWWFTGRFVYEIYYNNWIYRITRYNDTTTVTDISTYTHRSTFTAWLWQDLILKLRYWFDYENYNRVDWLRFFE